jgi:polar amino acid transport system permease protein
VTSSATLAYQWDFTPVFQKDSALLHGVLITIQVSFTSMAIGLVLSPLVALGRIYGGKLVGFLLWVYVETFRLTPMLVQLVWFLYVVPVTFGLRVSIFWLGVTPLALNLTAYLSETWRGGILGINRGLHDAALATGMTETMALRRIVLPMAFRQNIPIVATMWISLFKDSSLVGLVGIHELLYVGRDISNATFRPLETFSVVAVIYFVLTFPQSLLVGKLHERYRVHE